MPIQLKIAKKCKNKIKLRKLKLLKNKFTISVFWGPVYVPEPMLNVKSLHPFKSASVNCDAFFK